MTRLCKRVLNERRMRLVGRIDSQLALRHDFPGKTVQHHRDFAQFRRAA